MTDDLLPSLVSALLLIPYVGWGVYMLTQRYRYHNEGGPVVEAITLLCVLLFITVEISLFKASMRGNVVLYVFTLLGLMVSMAALYGHMAISFTSRLIVESISTGDDESMDTPRFGPVETLERQGDWEGALNECLVIARIYPRDPSVHLHMADNLLELKRPEEAAAALERALKYVTDSEKNLQVLNRLCEVLTRELDQPDRAVAALWGYLQKYPHSPYAASVQDRIDSAFHSVAWEAPEALASLDDMPVEEQAEFEEIVRENEHIALDLLEDAPFSTQEEEREPEEEPAAGSAVSPRLALSALEEAPLEEVEDEPLPRGEGPRLGLQALDDAPLEWPDRPDEEGRA